MRWLANQGMVSGGRGVESGPVGACDALELFLEGMRPEVDKEGRIGMISTSFHWTPTTWLNSPGRSFEGVSRCWGCDRRCPLTRT
jgi:hypothetical protein